MHGRSAHGLPRQPDQLSAHRLVTNNAVQVLNQWPFRVGGKPLLVAAQGHWRTNDTNMAASMVVQGLGIGRLATLVGDELVRRKLLVPVLADVVDLQPVPMYAVTTGGRHRLPKIRACIEHWAGWFGERAPHKAAAA